ncbi:hypothetical protein Gogos_015281 [Gossypium gossypioides]|uniref:RNase H type-1 domain-containing protein n=1 Tax=Gossypium gossypioides TaxID=34282 RepID=A0A7J9C157_GOSGO|nr:hypothetical protein [Gossypium gossypioides]
MLRCYVTASYRKSRDAIPSSHCANITSRRPSKPLRCGRYTALWPQFNTMFSNWFRLIFRNAGGALELEPESRLPGEQMQSTVRWFPPVHPLVKMNFDAGFRLGTLESRSGAVVRDNEGMVLAPCVHFNPSVPDSFAAEALACFQALSFARDMDFHAVEVEGDRWTVLSKLVATKIDSSGISPME